MAPIPIANNHNLTSRSAVLHSRAQVYDSLENNLKHASHAFHAGVAAALGVLAQGQREKEGWPCCAFSRGHEEGETNRQASRAIVPTRPRKSLAQYGEDPQPRLYRDPRRLLSDYSFTYWIFLIRGLSWVIG